MKQDFLKDLRAQLSKWDPILLRPTWCLAIAPELSDLMQALDQQPVEIREFGKAELYTFFEERLAMGRIALGRGYHGDAERKAIDTVVIHHTSMPPGLSPKRLSAIELIRLYAPYFASPTSDQDRDLKGRPISSGHVRNGKEVFWPYHWIVRRNGRTERLLIDAEIGWHAGNWDINCRSVAIVLDNDYEVSRPSFIELRAIASLITHLYGHVAPERIFGHCEINPKTVCPSKVFLNGTNRAGWKADILALLTPFSNAA